MCKLPDPFIIPVFRDSTEENLANEVYIVRVLATVILTTGSCATNSDCDHVAEKVSLLKGIFKYKGIYIVYSL